MMAMTEGRAGESQCEQRSNACRWQRRQYGEGMDIALIKDSEDEVDDHQRGADEQRLTAERVLKRLGATLERADHGGRHSDPGRGLLNRIDGLANCGSCRKIERKGDGRELALMRYRGAPTWLASTVTSIESGRPRL